MSDVNGPEPQESGHTAELPTVPGGVDLAALTASVAVPAPGEEYQGPPGPAGAATAGPTRGDPGTPPTAAAETSTATGPAPGPLAAPPVASSSPEASPSATGPSTAAGLGTDPNLVAMDDFTAPALDTTKW